MKHRLKQEHVGFLAVFAGAGCIGLAPIWVRHRPSTEELLFDQQRHTEAFAGTVMTATIAATWVRALAIKAERKKQKESRAAWRRWKSQHERETVSGGMLYPFVAGTQEDLDIAIKLLGNVAHGSGGRSTGRSRELEWHLAGS